MASTTKLTKRLDDMAIECQAEEKNVADQIGFMLKTKSYIP
jgi:TorA maturation chaperone TorD